VASQLDIEMAQEAFAKDWIAALQKILRAQCRSNQQI